jgi:tetratricopeptide (TPR) repeat protein
MDLAEKSDVKARLFLSYSRKDKDFALRLQSALQAESYEAVLDTTDIAPGEDWQARLAELILRADTVLFLVSPDSVGSSFCGWEIEEAARRGKRVLPLLVRKTPDADVPRVLARLNYIHFVDANAFDNGMAALEQALTQDIAWQREHTRFGEGAADWEVRGKPAALLLRGVRLGEAEQWLASEPAEAGVTTAAQRVFIAASRKAASTRQRNWVAGLVMALVVLGGFALFSYVQWQEAVAQRAVAEQQTKLAQDQTKLAETNEKKAQENERTAQANERRAVEQEQIATRNAEEARQQRDVAQQRYELARGTVKRVIFEFAQGFKSIQSLRADVVMRVLGEAQNALEQLSAGAPDDPEIKRLRGAMLGELGDALLRAGHTVRAKTMYLEKLEISRLLFDADPSNGLWRHDFVVSLARMGDLALEEGNFEEARIFYTHNHNLINDFVKSDILNIVWQKELIESYSDLGDLALAERSFTDAEKNYRNAIDVIELIFNYESDKSKILNKKAIIIGKIGDINLLKENYDFAKLMYKNSLEIARNFATDQDEDFVWQGVIGINLERLAIVSQKKGDKAGALKFHNEGLIIRRKFAASDPSNVLLKRNICISLSKIGDILFEKNNIAEARAAFTECVDIRRKITSIDPNNFEWQSDLAVSLVSRSQVARLRSEQIIDLQEAVRILQEININGKLTGQLEELLGAIKRRFSKIGIQN